MNAVYPFLRLSFPVQGMASGRANFGFQCALTEAQHWVVALTVPCIVLDRQSAMLQPAAVGT